ncbi:MAG: toxin-antitoxin system, toxin component, PIN family protein [Ignavibacteriales bacterium]|nr:MAG: toxin-antitoxin system, toxin component, PIN family protein [Ignavibacteriales bacterium]
MKKILLDSCVWGKAKEELNKLGYDVVWSGEWEQDPGDDEILKYAFSEKRILITLDKDFGELVIIKKIPHCGIIRLVNISARNQSGYSDFVLQKYSSDLEKGAIITVSSDKIRVRV